MKANMLDMIMYLFENYAADPMPTQQKHEMVTQELVHAGFSKAQIQWAVDWLKFIVNRKYEVYQQEQNDNHSFRVYSDFEEYKIDADCRGYLQSLEEMGLLDSNTREIVIEGLLSLNIDEIDIDDVKLVIQMVVANKQQYKAMTTWLKADETSVRDLH